MVQCIFFFLFFQLIFFDVFFYKGKNNVSSEECSKRLQQPQPSSVYEGFFEGLFKPNDLEFVRNELETLEITMRVNNPSEIPATDLGIGIRIFDSRKHY